MSYTGSSASFLVEGLADHFRTMTFSAITGQFQRFVGAEVHAVMMIEHTFMSRVYECSQTEYPIPAY